MKNKANAIATHLNNLQNVLGQFGVDVSAWDRWDWEVIDSEGPFRAFEAYFGFGNFGVTVLGSSIDSIIPDAASLEAVVMEHQGSGQVVTVANVRALDGHR